VSENEAKSLSAAPARTADDIRAEYTAISAYFGTVINFRFTTLGFFLAALNALASQANRRIPVKGLQGVVVFEAGLLQSKLQALVIASVNLVLLDEFE